MKRNALRLLDKLTFLSPRRRFELYPPFWLMRVKVIEMDEDWNRLRILLPLTWISANHGGSMFGGYQACLADPVPALACARHFPGYRMMTKSLKLDFIRPGNSDLLLHFDFDPGQKHAIAEELARNGRADPVFEMAYYRQDGEKCTLIWNTVAIRKPEYLERKMQRTGD